MVTVDAMGGAVMPANPVAAPAAAPAAAPVAAGTQVFSPFEGDSPVVELHVKEGDKVTTGQVVAEVEAMKANHQVKSPADGTVAKIHVALGDEVGAGNPIMTIQ